MKFHYAVKSSEHESASFLHHTAPGPAAACETLKDCHERLVS